MVATGSGLQQRQGQECTCNLKSAQDHMVLCVAGHVGFLLSVMARWIQLGVLQATHDGKLHGILVCHALLRWLSLD